MKRRTFLQVTAGGIMLAHDWPKAVLYASESSLPESFLHPPASTRAKTWWHWMNGNISREGITLDLQAMQRAGVGGVQVFQVGEGIPEGPNAYASPENLELLKYAAKEAERLGLEFGMMNGPGFSSSGGPWITPELSMQQLTWSETFIAGGKDLRIHLPEPYKKRGYYQDAMVLAFPSLDGEDRPLRDLLRRVTSSNGAVDIAILTNGDLSKSTEITTDAITGSAYLQFEFIEPYSARSLEFYGAARSLIWESSDDGLHFQKICDLEILPRDQIEVPAIATFPLTKAKYLRLQSPQNFRAAEIRLSGSQRISEWPLKANFVHRDDDKPFPATGELPKGSIIDPDSVIDLTAKMDSHGLLKWQAPAGNWTILRFGQTTTGAQNVPAPDGGLGLECDKYSKAAYDYHFNHFFGDMLPTLRSLASVGSVTAVIDSYEVGMQTWTKDYPEEFQRRRGYDLRKYMPSLTGRAVGSGEVSDRFLWDIRRTDADLMDDYYYGRFVELCHQHGITAYAEPYSGGPFEEMDAGSKLDVPMGEFWVGRGNQYSIKLASSIGHIFGKSIIAAESYTGNPVFTKWLQYPYAMKAQGDWMYTQGLNQFIFHAYAMQPHPTVQPGMTMGPWGWMHSRTNSWFSRESAWLQYVRRSQYMLRQGRLVADLVYFTGVEVPSNTPVWPDQLSPTPPPGYYYDVTNATGILNRMEVQNRQIILPDGMRYAVLILPEDRTITLQLLHKIRDLVYEGANLVGPKPNRVAGLNGYPECDAELQRLADEIWGDVDGLSVTQRAFNRGQVFWGEPLTAVLSKLNLKPDFECTSRSGDAPINYIHRRTEDADVYFLANRRRQSEDLVCTFRVENKRPELWNPETGDISPLSVYDLVAGGVRVPVTLGPAGSVFVVFRAAATSEPLQAITRNRETILTAKPFPNLPPGRYRDVANHFTLCVWVKPDVDMGLLPPNSRSLLGPNLHAYSYVIYPPAGNQVYGRGQAACGLAAARDGVVVYERTKGEPVPVLVAHVALAGWTHIAILYIDGKPSLYLNGKLVQEGQQSANVVHPGLGEALQGDGAAYFDGSMTKPQLFAEVLSQDRIQQAVQAGVPHPEEPPALEPSGNGSSELLIWQNGPYMLHSNRGSTSTLQISDIEMPSEIRGPWRVSFPANLGAPSEITLPELISLHQHQDGGVRYFSGTATYTRRFEVPASVVSIGRHLYLDLGRVAVLAEVRLNGGDLGSLWKPPFRVDVTGMIRPGENILEVAVTNLLTNRLIGDEQLPAEYEYSKREMLPFFGGVIKNLPQWYVDGKPKPPGGRITFATWKHYDRQSPLVESGLIGPVVLRTAVKRRLSA
ncbi:MAG: glycosyl hydrolase [Acidobacteriaceae bacterium]